MKKAFLIFSFCCLWGACSYAVSPIMGAEQVNRYIPLLLGKRVGLVVNQTSRVAGVHLVEFLRNHKVNVTRIFAPEHGFRGSSGAGEEINSGTDPVTGISIVSLYGKNNKPTPNQLNDLDIVVFDIQDVGCRFYTFISTLHLVMEACAEQHKPLLILDRPNPNGDYVAGPVLRSAFRSFVGMDPIALVHGCTVGELARMINGEGWLKNQVRCELTIIPVLNYKHTDRYNPEIAPSPNLPDYQAIRLYPSLCLFEATNISIGRGTDAPFQIIGFPNSRLGRYTFAPHSIQGKAVDPPQKDNLCFGEDLRGVKAPQFSLQYFIRYYQQLKGDSHFKFNDHWFNLLMGTDRVIQLIKEGKEEKEIVRSWKQELDSYRVMRKKYLLYPE